MLRTSGSLPHNPVGIHPHGCSTYLWRVKALVASDYCALLNCILLQMVGRKSVYGAFAAAQALGDSAGKTKMKALASGSSDSISYRNSNY